MTEEEHHVFKPLFEFQAKLNELKPELEERLQKIESKSAKIKDMDKQIKDLIEAQGNLLVSIEVGEITFKTKLKTLLSKRDSFFYKYIFNDVQNGQSITKEFYFDRSPKYFSLLLDFIRTGVLNYEGLPIKDAVDYLLEAEFYGIWSAASVLRDYIRKVEVISFTSSKKYSADVGKHTLEGLFDLDGKGGICVTSPYEITFELNTLHELSGCEIKGYTLNTNSWSPSYGEGADISISATKTGVYKSVGKIPSGFGEMVKKIEFKDKIACKYVKFKHSSYLGIGYINFYKSLNI